MEPQPSADAPRVSVVIPTYNGAARAAHVLRGLCTQGNAPAAWELVIVDNASTDGSGATLAADPSVAALRAAGVAVRIVPEPHPGLTHARLCGLREARAPLLCFLDDDTVPQAGYLAAGISAFADTTVGMLTSRVFPEYEVPPSPAIARREMMLALNHSLGDAPRDWGASATIAPTLGAGMWVRREALAGVLTHPDRVLFLSDRTGDTLASGGDIELGVLVGGEGYSRRYEPAARLRHMIPARRVTLAYFRRLVTGVVRSHLTLTRRYPPPPRPWTVWDRARSAARLVLAVLATPMLLLRPDGAREWVLVLTSRLAELRGPYRQAYISSSID